MTTTTTTIEREIQNGLEREIQDALERGIQDGNGKCRTGRNGKSRTYRNGNSRRDWNQKSKTGKSQDGPEGEFHEWAGKGIPGDTGTGNPRTVWNGKPWIDCNGEIQDGLERETRPNRQNIGTPGQTHDTGWKRNSMRGWNRKPQGGLEREILEGLQREIQDGSGQSRTGWNGKPGQTRQNMETLSNQQTIRTPGQTNTRANPAKPRSRLADNKTVINVYNQMKMFPWHLNQGLPGRRMKRNRTKAA